MGKELLIFGNIEIEKNKNYSNKAHFSKDVDIDKVLVSNKISLGEKNVGTLLVTCIMIIRFSRDI